MALAPAFTGNAQLLDQANEGPFENAYGCPLGTYSQSFKPALPILSRVELGLRASGSFPPEGFTTHIRIRAGGFTGPVLAESSAFVAGPLSWGTPVWVSYPLPNLPVVGGETCVIEWDSPPVSIFHWFASNPGEYPDGHARACTTENHLDMAFRTYGWPAPSAPAPIRNPANGRYYSAISIPGGVTWDEAALSAGEMGGYLATLTSADENQFVVNQFPAALNFGSLGYWIGGVQPDDTPDLDPFPDAGWEWVTGEPFSYSNWALGEPNDCTCEGPWEDAIQLWPEGVWNDLWRGVMASGFVVEFDRNPSDFDEDGIPNGEDGCPESNTGATIVIGGVDSGVENLVLEGGCTMADLINQAAAEAKNHGQFVSSVAKLTDALRDVGLISGREARAIKSAAARSGLPQ